MAGKVGGVEAGKFLFPHRKGADRQRVGGDTRRSQFLVKADVGIAVEVDSTPTFLPSAPKATTSPTILDQSEWPNGI